MDANLKALNIHCHDLSIIAYFIGTDYENNNHIIQASNWLSLAAGITKVDFNSDVKGDSIWCGYAREYEDKKSEYFTKIVNKLTVFQFIWCAVEILSSYIEEQNLTTTHREKDGKITKACIFLREGQQRPPVLYPEIYQQLKNKLIASSIERTAVNKAVNPRNFIGELGKGLHAVYQVRNSFAHGTLTSALPMDATIDDYTSGEGMLDESILDLSSRIILISIQMLLVELLYRVNSLRRFLNDEFTMGCLIEGCDEIERIELILKQVHLETPITVI